MFLSYFSFNSAYISTSFLIGLFVFLMPGFVSSLYFEYQPVIGCIVGQNISHSEGSCFVQMKGSFTLQKLFSFMKTHLLIVDHGANVNSVQKLFSSISEFKAIHYFLFYQVQCS